MKDEKTGDRNQNSAPVIELDVAYYQQFLDDADITDAQKRELIETLWTIVIQFVDLGFGIHPLQQARDGASAHSDAGQPIRAAIRDFAETEDFFEKEKTPEGTEV